MSRRLSQAVFLVLFLALLLSGKIRLWFAVFAFGTVLAVWFGRLYCGWACPINTLTELAARGRRALGLRARAVPGWVRSPFVRYGMIVLFILAMVLSAAGRIRLPVLPALVLLGVLFSFVYVEEMWHRYLCPFGFFLGLAARRTTGGYRIDNGKCLDCGECAAVCPGGAITAAGNLTIDRRLCLQCGRCAGVCPSGAVALKRENQT